MPKDWLHAANTRRTAAQKRHPNASLTLRTTSSTTLPPQLQSSVPRCAQPCLATYIGQGYGCPDDDLECLCLHYSSQGYTVGELAYICFAQDCPQSNTSESSILYYMCSSTAGAVQPTNTPLVPPATTFQPSQSSVLPKITKTSPKGTRSTSTTDRRTHSHSSRSLQTSHKSADSVSSAAATHSAVSGAFGPSASRSTRPTSATAASQVAATPTNQSAGLTGPQAAGVSVGAMGAVMIAIAAVCLCLCIRRRKVREKEDRQSYDFVDEAPPRFSPFNYGYADPRGPLGGFERRRAELMAEKRNSPWTFEPYSRKSIQRYEKNADISPQSRHSNESVRTLSQLLPDKPSPTFQRLQPKSPAASTFTAKTVFEEDRSPPAQSQKHLPRLPPPAIALPYPPPRKSAPPRKPVPPSYTNGYTCSPGGSRQPSLSLSIPKMAPRFSKILSPIDFPPPPVLRDDQSASSQRASNGSRANSTKSTGSLLNYYASPEAGSIASPVAAGPITSPEMGSVSSPTPIEDEVQKRKAIPQTITVTKPTYPPQAVRRDSAASDTSFESTDPDEPTPPDEVDKQLTPVEESPIAASPIAGIRYPKVPRSSNQAVPRSPKVGLSPKVGAQPKFEALPRQVKRPRPSTKAERKNTPGQHRQGGEPRQDPVTPVRKGTTSSALSGSTLAAKRVGSSAAQDLERTLHLADPARSRTGSHGPTQTPKSGPRYSGKNTQRNRQESPLKGYGRVASNGRGVSRSQLASPVMKSAGPHLWKSPGLPGEVQQVALKSPLWEPKLTPSRRGDDLYLSVGIGSPKASGLTPMSDAFQS